VYSSRLPYRKDATRIAILAISMASTYIKLNTNFRTLAKNDFEKNIQIDEQCSGKLWQNHKERVQSRRCAMGRQIRREAMIAKPNFHSRSVFSENLVAIEMRKLEMKFNEPIYVSIYIYIYKITFFKKRVKKSAKYTLFAQSKQNNNFIFQKSCPIYTFYKKYDIRKWRQAEFKKGL